MRRLHYNRFQNPQEFKFQERATKPMIVPTKKLFAHAYGKYALGAYTINNSEQIMGPFRGAY
jgi:hypothetical protein